MVQFPGSGIQFHRGLVRLGWAGWVSTQLMMAAARFHSQSRCDRFAHSENIFSSGILYARVPSTRILDISHFLYILWRCDRFDNIFGTSAAVDNI